MFKVTVETKNGEKTATFNKKILLWDALWQMGFKISKPCGGKGICGNCKVNANGEIVASCKTYINDDTYVKYNIDIEYIQGVTYGMEQSFNKNPLVDCGYGMAVDIGTTTIAGYIYKFPECELIKSLCVTNNQVMFGADIISRIEYSNNGGLQTLKNLVSEQIKELSAGCDIKKYIITGNTTMLHLLTGKSPYGIGVYPFTPETLFGNWYENAYLPRCISAYIGADITTAILATGMLSKNISFMVDIGTNGEMALWHNGKLICCATAAGPAFEGAGISCGVPAVSGAINKVYIKNGKIEYETIDQRNATGICGSGLVDAISIMLTLGIIDETGYLEENFEIADSGIYITQEDIRNFQLAKSAIRAGIDTLLHECGIDYSELEAFYIAGGFGSFINIESAVKVGLIPPDVSEKVISCGNSAGIGATMILQNEQFIEASNNIAELAQCIELSTNEYFMDKYINNMSFNN